MGKKKKVFYSFPIEECDAFLEMSNLDYSDEEIAVICKKLGVD